MSRHEQRNRNYLRLFIVPLIVIVGLLFAVGCEGVADNSANYISYFDEETQEGQIIDAVSLTNDICVYPFKISDECSNVKVIQRIYKYGKLVDKKTALSTNLEDVKGIINGIVSINPYITANEKLELNTSIVVKGDSDGKKASSQDELTEINLKRDGDLFGADRLNEKKEILRNKETEIFSYDFAGKGGVTSGVIGNRISDPKIMEKTKWSYVYSFMFE